MLEQEVVYLCMGAQAALKKLATALQQATRGSGFVTGSPSSPRPPPDGHFTTASANRNFQKVSDRMVLLGNTSVIRSGCGFPGSSLWDRAVEAMTSEAGVPKAQRLHRAAESPIGN
jgi:hypothetical protein